MKIIAELSQLSNGQNYPHLTAFDEEGRVCDSMTMTLLQFVSELHPPADALFEKLLTAAKENDYFPENPDLADFSVNDKLVWLRPPEVQAGLILISNENVPDYSVDGGNPQAFSVDFFWSVQNHWRNFLRLVKEEGDEKWLNRKLEFDVK